MNRKVQKKNQIKKWLKRITITFVSIVFLAGLVSVVYISNYYHSAGTLEAYQRQTEVPISESDSLIQLGKGNDIGIIFYPGGKVEYTAYVPLMSLVAERGYTCFIPKMPGNLAVFGIDRAQDIIDKNPDIHTWYLAGHSLGGAMGSSYAAKNAEKLDGIIFLGAYPAYDLRHTGLKMLSVVGSKDGVVNREKLETAKSYAPVGAIYNTIEGGNHAYFGDYGEQDGDGTASIAAKDQQQQTAKLIAEFCRP